MATPQISSDHPTLLDIAKRNSAGDGLLNLIDETTKATPEVRMGAARTIKGRSYSQYVRTSLPASPFRLANQGVPISKATYELRTVSTTILNPIFQVDRAVADGSEDGPQKYIADEGEAQTEAAIQALGRSFYYGSHIWMPTIAGVLTPQGGSVSSFPGLLDLYDNTYEFDAGGTPADIPQLAGAPAYGVVPAGSITAAGSPYGATSVYGVKFGDKNVQWVWGQNGSLDLEDVKEVVIQDNAGRSLTVYHQELLAYPGLQLGDRRGVVRIKNITPASATATNTAGHPLTDKILADALVSLPANIVPDAWFMTRAAVTALRDSRTATNTTGDPAPIPTDYAGIPIYLTDSLSNFEPLQFLAK